MSRYGERKFATSRKTSEARDLAGESGSISRLHARAAGICRKVIGQRCEGEERLATGVFSTLLNLGRPSGASRVQREGPLLVCLQ